MSTEIAKRWSHLTKISRQFHPERTPDSPSSMTGLSGPCDLSMGQPCAEKCRNQFLLPLFVLTDLDEDKGIGAKRKNSMTLKLQHYKT